MSWPWCVGLALYAAKTGHDLENGWLAAAIAAGSASLLLLVVGLWRPSREPPRRRLDALRHLGLAAAASALLLVGTIFAVPLPRSLMTHPPGAWETLPTTWTYVAWPVAVLLVVGVLSRLHEGRCAVAPQARARARLARRYRH